MAEKLYYSMGEVTEMFDVEASLIRYWCSQFTCLRPKRNAKGNRLFTPQDIERLKRIHHLLKEKKMTIEGAQKAMRKRNIEAEKNDSDITLLEQLQSLRAMLVDMRNNMGEPLPEESIVEELHVEEPLVVAQPAEPIVEVQPVAEVVAEEVAAKPVAEPAEEVVEEVAAEPIVEVVEEPTVEVAAEPAELTIEDIFEQKTEADVEVVEPTVEESAEPQAEVVAEPQMEIAAEPIAAVAEPQPQQLVKPKKKRAPRRKLIGEEGVVERPLFPFYEQTLF
jgi:DNA-binding transcriptional MerR regulator